jgi:zinc transport system substrate-binding protein
VAALLALGACRPSDGDEYTVVAFPFAVAEAARGVVPDDVKVIDFARPGVEAHDLEFTSRQVDQVEDSDRLVYVDGLLPAIDKIRRRNGGSLRLGTVNGDPHIWLDPVKMREVADAFAGIPGASADRFHADLDALHREYEAGLKDCARRVLVTAHDAFGLLAARYGLETEAVTGIDPEAEPDPGRLAQLADLVRRTGTTTVFTEAKVSAKVADALAREAGVKTTVLDTLEAGEPGTYFIVMRQNLRAIRNALGCT